MLDALPDACIAVSADGTVTGWNLAAMAMFGWSAEEAIGTALVGLVIPPESRAAHQAGFTRAVSTGRLHSPGQALPVVAIRRDGTTMPVELTVGSLPVADGAECYALVRDVSGREAAARQRDEQAQLWERVFTDAQIGMAVVGLDTCFQRVNRRLVTLLGRDQEQLLGASLASITHPDDVADSMRDLQELLSGRTVNLERVKRYLRGDGQALWVRRTASVLRGADGAPRQVLLQVQDVTAERQALDDLRRLAHTDQLTGLGNREQLRLSADSRSTGCAVLLIDLDDFKRINDSLGHAAGDAVLIEVGRRIAAVCRPGDLAVRLGGDEFAVLLLGADDAAARAVCDRLQHALDPLVAADGTHVKIDATIGATTDSTTDAPLGSMLREADLAMYAGKAAGKRSSRLFEAGMLMVSRREMRLENELRQALRGGRLSLAYQPIIDLVSGRIAGVEALCRWNHPQLGAISPAEFIPLAERTGLIDELTSWVLTKATTTVAGWDAAHPAGGELSVSVNVACSTAESPGFVELVLAALAGAALAPERLVLEITENGLAASQAALVDAMWVLDRHGVRFALDDFGTGYSSLARLAELPFSSLKLDRSFVGAITTSETPAPLVHATVAMASGLNVAMIAEGVETPAQLAALIAAGCRYAQGYLIGRPAAAGHLLELLRSEHPGPVRPAPGPPHAADLRTLVRTIRTSVRDEPNLRIETVRQLLTELAQLIGVESTYLTRVDWAASRQELQVVHNAGALTLPEGLLVEWSDTLCRRALLGGPALTDDVPGTYPDSAAAAELGLQTYLTAPVTDPQGNLYGTLCGASSAPIPVEASHLGTFHLFARLIGERLPRENPA